MLNEFKLETGSNVETVQIHYGPYADELARSLHTLALVLGTDIFFRNGAYRPETEEGRKILAHELTHVTQQKRDILRGETTREELEREAPTSVGNVKTGTAPKTKSSTTTGSNTCSKIFFRMGRCKLE